MGLVDAFHFLLSNCNSSYKHFDNILSYFVENPKYYTHESIGLSTEKIIHSSLSKLYLLFQSIIGESTTLSENSPLETRINIVNFSISNSLQNYSSYFVNQESITLSTENQSNQSLLNIFDKLLSNLIESNHLNEFNKSDHLIETNESFQFFSKICPVLDPTIPTTEIQSISELHNIFINKFNQFLKNFKTIYFTLTGYKLKLCNERDIYQFSEQINLFIY
jgi:hypothetical protein